ncbi:hypothetical protein HNR06_000058 [Nocardiopsis arvandica]|uniref:DUF4350 domain-containing protein n=1 Tax=Nocardiopsis sinuspersici TaxID=501010 RepID=A0A7Y9X759_9ACTN|nr:hypothetical protein [Nocardiopsis sinuspersici]NYH50469.1 hypothetical protein [Nocardiopsis sinuspersici]
MSTARVRRALLSTALAALALCAPSSPAWAVDSVAEVTDLSRVERIAGELEDGPLYVHHDLRDLWTDESLARVEERLLSEPLADLDVRVVVYPSVPHDETAGRPTLFLQALHEVSGRDGVYVAMTGDRRVALAAFDSTVHLPDVDTDVLHPAHSARTEQVLDLVAQAPRGSVASSELTPDVPPSDRDPVRHPRGDAERFWSAALLPGALIGLALVVVRVVFSRPSTWRPLGWRSRWLLRSWVRLRERAGDPYRPRRAPNRAWRWWLRPTLGRELRRLRLLVEAASENHPGRERAVQSYDAAGLIAQSPELPPQAMVCAVVVARDGAQAITHPDLPLRTPCQINPLHGPAGHSLREYAHRQRLSRWQVCDRCSKKRFDPRFGPLTPSLPLLADGGRHHYRYAKDPWAEAITAPEHVFTRIRRELEV